VLTGWGADIIKDPYKIPMMKYLVRYVLKKADYVTVFSKYLLKNINKITKKIKNKEVIVPWRLENYKEDSVMDKLVNKLKNELGIPVGSFIILSPRNIQPIYRIEKIVHSIPLVIKNYPETIFIFLKGRADEKYYNKIQSLIKNLSIEKNTIMVKRWLNDKEMIAIYTIADAIVSIPTKDQFSMSIRESMVCGAVPIISNLEIYSELLEKNKNAFFVSGDDSKEIADKITYCIENPEILGDIKARNEDLIKQYDNTENKLDKMEKMTWSRNGI